MRRFPLFSVVDLKIINLWLIAPACFTEHVFNAAQVFKVQKMNDKLSVETRTLVAFVFNLLQIVRQVTDWIVRIALFFQLIDNSNN